MLSGRETVEELVKSKGEDGLGRIYLQCRPTEVVESKSQEGLFSCIGTVADTGQHSHSCRCRIQIVFSLDNNIKQNTLLLNAGFGCLLWSH